MPLHVGLAPRVAVSRRAAFPVPPSVDANTAALTEPVAVAVHAVRRAPRTLGATVVVLGAGPIGLAVLQSVRTAGAGATIVSEPSAARRACASAAGATVVVDPHTDDVRSAVRDHAPAGCDLVFDTAGAAFAFTYVPEVEFPIALGLLESGALDAQGMITDHISLDRLVEDGIHDLLHNADAHVKILVDPHAG
jgi:threonine dehydrogenase-like Zn-dependent dehydrogenase